MTAGKLAPIFIALLWHSLAPAATFSGLPGAAPVTTYKIPVAIVENLEDLRSLDQLGTSYLNAFDEELEHATLSWSLGTSEPYRNLLAIRSLTEKKNAELEDLIQSANLPGKEKEFIKAHLRASSKSSSAIANEVIFIGAKSKLKNEIEAHKAEFIFQGGLEIGAKFQPSNSRLGNINGSEFPANTWALTFDDGPHTEDTESALAVMDKFKIKGTFFWLAKRVEYYPKLAQRVGQMGHARENHSFTHPNLTRLSVMAAGNKTSLTKEISYSNSVLAKLYGETPRFFRLPGGNGIHKDRVRDMIARENMIHVHWNVDSNDWKDRNVDSIARRVLAQMQWQARKGQGGIILFHDIHPQGPKAAAIVLSEHQNKRWVTIPQIVDELNR